MSNSYKMFAVLLFVLLAVSCQAQEFSWGGCPDYKVKENFDTNAFLGKWYTMYKFYNRFEDGGKCNMADYSKNLDGTLKVYNEMLKDGGKKDVTGKAWFPGKTDIGKLMVNMGTPFFDAPYWILDTDYTNYGVVYSCNNFLFGKFESLWILARSRNPSQISMDRAWTALNERSLPTSKLQTCDQSFCFN